MEEGGRGLLRRIADRQAGKGGRHRRIADRRAREEGKIKGSAAGSPVVATRGGKRPYQPSLAFVHPFPLGTPKVDSPSQRRQGTAERGKCPQTGCVCWGGGGGRMIRRQKRKKLRASEVLGPWNRAEPVGPIGRSSAEKSVGRVHLFLA